MSTPSRKRDESQIVMSAALSRELLATVDDYCAVNDMTRSQFLRSAFCNELKLRGVTVDNALLRAPAKAGRPTSGGDDASKNKPAGSPGHVSHGPGASHGEHAQNLTIIGTPQTDPFGTHGDAQEVKSDENDGDDSSKNKAAGNLGHVSYGPGASHGKHAKNTIIIGTPPPNPFGSPPRNP